MAYQTRTRDPLFDSETQAALEKRARELVGILLIGASALMAMMLASYAPDDPSWLSSTDEPAQNLLGRFGASIASPLIVIAGFGAWAIVGILFVWGVRLCAHMGADRAVPRLIFAPIAVALASVYASTLLPTSEWTHSFGLGGLFGDTVLGAILGLVPVKATLGLKVLSLVVGVGTAAMVLYVLGCTKDELRAFWRFMLRGTVMVYAMLFAGVRQGAIGGASLARGAAAKRAQRRAERQSLEELEARPVTPPEDVEMPEPKRGLLSRLFRRAPDDAEYVELGMPDTSDDRVRARIADVIKSKGVEPAPGARRAEPPVTSDDAPMPEMELVDEPPVGAPTTPLFSSNRIQHPPRKSPAPSSRARAEEQPALFDGPPREYDAPPLGLLESPDTVERLQLSHESLEANARMLEAVLDDYGVKGDIVSVRPGPVVTMYELEPAPGLKASRVIGLADDIARQRGLSREGLVK